MAAYPYRRYRFIRPDGTSTYDSLPASAVEAVDLPKLAERHRAERVEPVGPTPAIGGTV